MTSLLLRRKWQRAHPPDDDTNIDSYIKRYEKSNWDYSRQANQAHYSIVKYKWRKEHELNRNRKADNSESTQIDREHSNSLKNSSDESQNRNRTDVETPTRGIHFRTIEDKTFDKLNHNKFERKFANTTSYIEKFRRKGNTDKDDDISEDLKRAVRGKSAYQISSAILAETEEHLKHPTTQQSKKIQNEQDRVNRTRTTHRVKLMDESDELRCFVDSYVHDVKRKLPSLNRRNWNYDPRWNCNYLNLVSYRMQNDLHRGCRMQNEGDIYW